MGERSDWGEKGLMTALEVQSRGVDSPLLIPDRVNKLQDHLIESRLEFAALSKLYVANNSPENVKKILSIILT